VEGFGQQSLRGLCGGEDVFDDPGADFWVTRLSGGEGRGPEGGLPAHAGDVQDLWEDPDVSLDDVPARAGEWEFKYSTTHFLVYVCMHSIADGVFAGLAPLRPARTLGVSVQPAQRQTFGTGSGPSCTCGGVSHH
jgi:hypothetical protein